MSEPTAAQSTTDQPAVVVIGAGIIGVSTAYHLATRHHLQVTLVTDGNPVSGASGRSLSWLNTAGATSIRTPEYHGLRLAGMERYRALSGDPASARFLRFDGGFTWADPGESFKARHAAEVDVDYPSEWIYQDQVAERLPGVAADVVAPEGGILNPNEGWVDLPGLAAYLLPRFVAAGGRIVANAGTWNAEVAAGRVTGARSSQGQFIPADRVLIATGPWTPALLGELGVNVPDSTPKSLLIQAAPADAPHPLRAVLNTPRVALRPAPGGLFALDSDWATAGVEVDEAGRFHVDRAVALEQVDEARAVLAGNPRLEIVNIWAGMKPVPGDGDPVLGPVPGIEGLSVAFTHSGATLALVAGELLAGELATGAPAAALETFRLSRFAQGPQASVAFTGRSDGIRKVKG